MSLSKFAIAALVGVVSAVGDGPDVWDYLPTIVPNVADFTEAWWDSKVDHLNYQSDLTYKQRYWYNELYCADKTTCPIFVYICGEYTCSVPGFRMFPFMIGAERGA